MTRTFTIITTLLVAGLAWFALRQSASGPAASARPAPAQPGYYMIDARITETGPDGRPLYSMSAQRIQQDPANQSIRLDSIRFVYDVPADGTPRAEEADNWTLTAGAGLVSSLDARTIDLLDDVRIVGRPSLNSTQGTAVIRTSRLRVDAAASTAVTRERVEMEWGGCQMSGTGLKADLKRKTLQIESRIHANCVR